MVQIKTLEMLQACKVGLDQELKESDIRRYNSKLIQSVWCL